MTEQPESERLGEMVTGLVPVVLRTLDALEQVQRHTHPGRFEQLAAILAPLRPDLEAVAGAVEGERWPDRLAGLGEAIATAARETRGALERCIGAAAAADPFLEWLRGMRGRYRAMEALYPLAAVFTPVNQYFVETPLRGSVDLLARLQAGMRGPPSARAEGGVGVMNAGNTRRERGGFSLYVPEHYDPATAMPLVVALHGGSGHGADFLWTWLREARGRGFLLLCPTARDGTWSLMGDDVDAEPIARMVEYVAAHWNVDRARVLLTGMSDGATYASLLGLYENAPFTALAPLCGIFHPMNAFNGNMARVSGKRIYLLHGALDWMFSVDTARLAHEQLRAAGADVTYREVPDLSHTYPRDENDAILRWFEPALALPAPAPGDRPPGE
jgi:phospholipase/carboxylesterase